MKTARLTKRDKDSLTITMDGLSLRTSGTDLPNHVILLVNDGRDEVHYSLDNACRESSGCVMKKTQPVPHIQSWQSLRDIQTAHLQHGAVLLDKTTDKHTYPSTQTACLTCLTSALCHDQSARATQRSVSPPT